MAWLTRPQTIVIIVWHLETISPLACIVRWMYWWQCKPLSEKSGILLSIIFHPRPPSAPTGIVVSHCVRPSVCPPFRPSQIKRCHSNSLSISAWHLVCTVSWSMSLLTMAMLGQFFCVPRNFEIFHDRLWADLSGERHNHSNSIRI